MRHELIEKLISLRREAGISESRLGKLAGVGQNTISLWENYKRSPTLFNFEAVLNALGHTIHIVALPENRLPHNLEKLYAKHRRTR